MVNLIRKRPTREFQGSLTGRYGSWDTHYLEADLSGPLDEQGRVRGRTVISRADTNGDKAISQAEFQTAALARFADYLVVNVSSPNTPGLRALQSRDSLEPLLDALIARVIPAAEAIFADRFELVLVNDGSKDASWDVICAHAERDPRIVAINLSRNHGHQLALTAGLHHVRGQLVFVLDADLQDDPLGVEVTQFACQRLDDGRNSQPRDQRTVQHADEHCQHQHRRHQREFQRGREALGDQARDLGPLAQAQAKLALRRVGQEMPKLNHKRLIQSQVGAQFSNLLCRGVLSQQKHHRVAHILEQHERNQRHADHHDHRLSQPPENECKHRFLK